MNSTGFLVILLVPSILHISVANIACVKDDEKSCVQNQNWPAGVGDYFTKLVLNRVTIGLAVGTVLLALIIIFIAMTCLKLNHKDELPFHVLPTKHTQSSQSFQMCIPEVDDDGFVSIALNDKEDKTQEYGNHYRGQEEPAHQTVIRGNGDERVVIWR